MLEKLEEKFVDERLEVEKASEKAVGLVGWLVWLVGLDGAFVRVGFSFGDFSFEALRPAF